MPSSQRVERRRRVERPPAAVITAIAIGVGADRSVPVVRIRRRVDAACIAQGSVTQAVAIAVDAIVTTVANPVAVGVHAIVERIEEARAAVITAIAIGVGADGGYAVVRVGRRTGAACVAPGAITQAVAIGVHAIVTTVANPVAVGVRAVVERIKRPAAAVVTAVAIGVRTDQLVVIVRVRRRVDAAHIAPGAVTQAVAIPVYADVAGVANPVAVGVRAIVERVERPRAAVITGIAIGVGADRSVVIVRIGRRAGAAHVAPGAITEAIAVRIDADVPGVANPVAVDVRPSSSGSNDPVLQSSQLSPSVSAQTVASPSFESVVASTQPTLSRVPSPRPSESRSTQSPLGPVTLAGFDRALLVREATFAGKCAELDGVASLRSGVDAHFVAACADDCTVGILRDGVEPILARFGNTDRRPRAAIA